MRTDVKRKSASSNGKKKLTLRQKLIVALGVVLCLAIIIFASAYGVFLHYYNKMNITSINDNDEIVTAIDYEEDEINEQELTEEERQQLEQFFEEVNSYSEEDADSKTEDKTKDKSDDKKADSKTKDESKDGTKDKTEAEAKDKTESKDNAETVTSVKTDSKSVTNILLVGTDSRAKGNKRSRTDTMIILSIDKKNKRVTMTSVLRDTYVKIPGVGKNRLNAAFVFGGPKLLFKTFDENFGIHLDKYVQIDFYNFIKLVDAVGGVDLKLTPAEIKVMNVTYIPYINKGIKKKNTANLIKQNKSGVYHLNGVQALAYSRVRYVGTDFARTERQRKVIGEIIKKTKKLSVSELNSLADIVLPMVSTNLSKGEVMSLVMNAKEYLNYKIVNGRMPINGSYKYMKVRGASVLGVNFETNKKYWYKLVYGK